MDTTTKELDKQETEPNPLDEVRKQQFKIFDLVGDGFGDEPEPEEKPEDDEPEKTPAQTDETKPSEGEGEDVETSPEPKENPEEEPKKEPAPPSAPKVTVRKKEKPLPDIPPFEPEKKPAPATAFDAQQQQQQQQQQSPSPEEPADLTPDEQEELELARFADREKPGTYRANLDFILKRREFVKQRMADEGRGYRPSRDAEYREWVEENAPMKPGQRKQLERRKLQEELRQEIEQGNRKREDELRREIEALKKKPEIEKKSTEFRREMDASLPETLKEVFPEIEEAESAVEEMRPLLTPVTERHSRLVETLLELSSGVAQFDASNPAHNYISRFVDDQARYFEANGGANLFRNGRRFVRPELASQIPAGQQHLYWTFSEADIVQVFAEQSRRETRQILEAERKKWEKFQKIAPKKDGGDGKRKPNGKQSPPPPPARTEDLGPSAETSPSPGASGGSEQDSPPPSFLSLLNS